MQRTGRTDRTHPTGRGAGASGDTNPRRLVRAIAAGREPALRELFEACHWRVYQMALELLQDPARAERATVAVFAEAWRGARHFEAGQDDVDRWIDGLTRASCAVLLRRARGIGPAEYGT